MKAEFTKEKFLALAFAIVVFLVAITLSSATSSIEVFYGIWAIGFLGSLFPVVRWARRKLAKSKGTKD